jgi:hypothetical protein
MGARAWLAAAIAVLFVASVPGSVPAGTATLAGCEVSSERIGESPGMLPLLRALDPRLAGEIRERLDEIRQRILDIPAPFDAIILSSADDPRRRRYQALAGEFIGLSGALRRAGARAGVTVTIGGGG